MKIKSTHELIDDNNNVTQLGTTEKTYSTGVDMDIEIEMVHDPSSSTGHPLPRPKTAPKF